MIVEILETFILTSVSVILLELIIIFGEIIYDTHLREHETKVIVDARSLSKEEFEALKELFGDD